MLQQSTSRLALGVGYFNIYFIWGATFIAITYGLASFPPFILTGLRFFIAGLILLAYRAYKKDNLFIGKNWLKNGIVGLLILTFGTGLLVWAEQYVSATEAAVAIGAGPFWFILIDRKQWKTNFRNPFLLIGFIIGFTGLLVFLNHSITEETAVSFQQKLIAYFVLALSSISWVLGSLFSRKHKPDQPFLLNSAQQLTIAGVGAFIFAIFQGEWASWQVTDLKLSAVLGLGFLIFFGSIIAYISYTWLLTQQPPSRVSTHTFINPIVAAILSYFLFQVHLNAYQIFAFILILSGVMLINVKWSWSNYRYFRIKYHRQLAVLKRISVPYGAYINNIW